MATERWRITLMPEGEERHSYPVRLDRVAFDVTITDGRTPQAVAATLAGMLGLSRPLSISAVEPIVTREQVDRHRSGIEHSGLTRDEVDDFLRAIGYRQDPPEETARKG